ncbi:MAG: hypothetical protein QXL54_05250, partial [Candidatus Bathyarchaeia archaeon]
MPVNIGSTTSTYGLRFVNQVKSVVAVGRLWIFYSDGSNLAYSSSVDGKTWATPATIRSCSDAGQFSVFLYGSNTLYYVWANASQLYVGIGTLNSDGSISNISETSYTTISNAAYYPTIARDSNYLMVGFKENNYPYVMVYNYNTSQKLIHQLSSTSADWRVSIIKGDLFYVIYAINSSIAGGDYLRGRYYDTANEVFSDEITASEKVMRGYFCPVWNPKTQKVEISYDAGLQSNAVAFISFTMSGWSSPTILYSNADKASVLCLNTTTTNVNKYVFWINAPTVAHVYFRKFRPAAQMWTETCDWFTAETTLTINIATSPYAHGMIEPFFYQLSGYIKCECLPVRKPLHEVINGCLNAISSWTDTEELVQVGRIFGTASLSDLETVCGNHANNNYWLGVFRCKRIAELNQLQSTTIDNHVKTALTYQPMFTYYPVPITNTSGGTWFCHWDHPVLHGYRWAQELNWETEKWNKNAAYNRLKEIRLGEQNVYYLVNADTGQVQRLATGRWHQCGSLCNVWLIFEDLGASGTPTPRSMALLEWSNLNNKYWTTNETYGNHFRYLQAESVGYEYFIYVFYFFLNLYGREDFNLENIERIITDVSNRFFAYKWQSPAWGWTDWDGGVCNRVVRHHYPNNPQNSTRGSLLGWFIIQFINKALPLTIKNNLRDMILGETVEPAYILFLDSDLFDWGCMKFFEYGDQQYYSNTGVGLLLLLLMGIAPNTGSLALPFYTSGDIGFIVSVFDTRHFGFDYANRKLKIPVFAGSITFKYGTTAVNYTFPSNGIYEITFSSDWNSITNVNKLSDLYSDVTYFEVYIKKKWDTQT